ncbi:MAG: potassium channel protein [Pyrinomonadaceae bacterium]|nr:potassium channel protein [Pyrinomonadaceae bacterium]
MSRTTTRLRSVASRFSIRFGLIAIAVMLALGTVGFHLIEGWPWVDSLYTATQTVTTVGYGDIAPQTFAGRLFATVFMMAGVGTVLYALTSIVQTVVQSEMVAAFGQRRRSREIRRVHNHFIICGAGRVGSRIIREMQRAKCRFVVIEREQPKVAGLIAEGAHVIVSDATLEETLKEAGVERARALAACLPNDADNVYVVLLARDLNEDLHIVARAVEEQAEPKLVRAGANRVVSPTIIGSRRMAEALIKPALADFMDSITAENLDLGFDEVELQANSIYIGRKLKYTNIRSDLDVVIVAIRRRRGEMIFNPTGDTILEAGDLLIAIGRAESLLELDRQAGKVREKV